MPPYWPPLTAPLPPCFPNPSQNQPLESNQMGISPELSQLRNTEMGYGVAGAWQLHWDSGHTPSDPKLYSGLNSNNNFVQEGALRTEEHAFPGWQHPYSAAPSNPFPDPIDTDHNSYPPEGFLPAFDPAIFDKPYDNGRYLCNVSGCESTFTRLADRNRHVNSKHNNTPHFCLILGCEKSFERGGKGYTRQDKLQEHMQKKHAVSAEAAV